MSRPRRAALTMLSLLAVAAAQAAAARPASPAASPTAVAQAITDCRKLTDRDARLDCYDKAAEAFEQAQASGQVVVVDREQVRAVKRQAFGFSMPSLNLFARGPKEEQVEKISVTLVGARQDGLGKWVMTTEEDAVWTQTDSSDLFNPPHAGSILAVRKAALGSFFCKVDGQSAIRCTRSR